MRCEDMAGGDRLVYRISGWSAVSCGDGLGAAEMHQWLTGNLGAESQEATTMIARFVSDLAQQMAPAMIAGAAARSIGRSGCRYNDDTHVTLLALVVCQASTRVILTFCSDYLQRAKVTVGAATWL